MNEDDYIGDIASRLKFRGQEYEIQHTQKLDSVGDQVKLERQYGDNGFSDERTMRKIGSIPSIFAMQPKYRDLIDGDQKAFKKAARRFFDDHPEFRVSSNNY